eukprot:333748-Prorocentrum_minimum.AAC.1
MTCSTSCAHLKLRGAAYSTSARVKVSSSRTRRSAEVALSDWTTQRKGRLGALGPSTRTLG